MCTLVPLCRGTHRLVLQSCSVSELYCPTLLQSPSVKASRQAISKWWGSQPQPADSCCMMSRLVHLHMDFIQNYLTAPSVLQMPVFRAIKQWRAGQPAGSPGLLFNLLMMVRLEHLQGDALHQLLQDELIRADVQCSQLVAHAALQIAGTATDHFPCRPVRSFAQVQIQVSRLVVMLPDTCRMRLASVDRTDTSNRSETEVCMSCKLFSQLIC